MACASRRALVVAELVGDVGLGVVRLDHVARVGEELEPQDVLRARAPREAVLRAVVLAPRRARHARRRERRQIGAG